MTYPPFLPRCGEIATRPLDNSGPCRRESPDVSCHFRVRNTGFTLLEVAIYIALLLILGAPLVTLVLTSARATAENSTIANVEERNRTAIFRIEKELRKSMSGSPVVGGSGTTLTFTSTAGFDGTGPTAGPLIRFYFRASQDETVNGVDDNLNGIADEGELVWSDLSTGAETVISSAVDMNGSGFVMDGTGVTITLASFGSLDRRYGSFSVSRNLTVYPRN